MTVRNEQPAMLAAGDDYDDFDDLLDASSLGAPHVVAARQNVPESMREHLREAAAAARNAPAPTPPASDAAHHDAGSRTSVVVEGSSSVDSAAGRTVIPGTGVTVIDFGTTASSTAVWEPPQSAEMRIGLWGPTKSGKSTLLNALIGGHHDFFPEPAQDGPDTPGDLVLVDTPRAVIDDPWLYELMLRVAQPTGQDFSVVRHLTPTLTMLPRIMAVYENAAAEALATARLLSDPSPFAEGAAASVIPAVTHARSSGWAVRAELRLRARAAVAWMTADLGGPLRGGAACSGVACDPAGLWHHGAASSAAFGLWPPLPVLGIGGTSQDRIVPGHGAVVGWIMPGALLASVCTVPVDGFLASGTAGLLALRVARRGDWPNPGEGTQARDRAAWTAPGFGRSRLPGAASSSVRSTDGVCAVVIVRPARTVEGGLGTAAAVILLASRPPARLEGFMLAPHRGAAARRAHRRRRGTVERMLWAAAGTLNGWQRRVHAAQAGALIRWEEQGARTWPGSAKRDAVMHRSILLPLRPASISAVLLSIPDTYRWPAAGVPPEIQHRQLQDQDQEEERGKPMSAAENGGAGRTRTPAQRRPSPSVADVRTRGHRDVHRDLRAWVLNENGHAEGVPVRLTYTAADPYVVCLIFRTSRGQVVWNLARELLSQALDRRAGTGDVVAWSQDDEHLAPEERSTFLLLRPGNRLALLGLSREQLRAFLTQTWKAVASGAEYDLCMLALAGVERELHTAWAPDNG